MSCVFCKIVSGEIPSQKVSETDAFLVIRDIHPQAPTHLLVLPKTHVESLAQAPEALLGPLLATGIQAARAEGLMPGGFRSVINTGVHGGQTVFHLHLHILGGEPLSGRFG